jgi:hypothetical protein
MCVSKSDVASSMYPSSIYILEIKLYFGNNITTFIKCTKRKKSKEFEIKRSFSLHFVVALRVKGHADTWKTCTWESGKFPNAIQWKWTFFKVDPIRAVNLLPKNNKISCQRQEVC